MAETETGFTILGAPLINEGDHYSAETWMGPVGLFWVDGDHGDGWGKWAIRWHPNGVVSARSEGILIYDVAAAGWRRDQWLPALCEDADRILGGIRDLINGVEVNPNG